MSNGIFCSFHKADSLQQRGVLQTSVHEFALRQQTIRVFVHLIELRNNIVRILLGNPQRTHGVEDDLNLFDLDDSIPVDVVQVEDPFDLLHECTTCRYGEATDELDKV